MRPFGSQHLEGRDDFVEVPAYAFNYERSLGRCMQMPFGLGWGDTKGNEYRFDLVFGERGVADGN